MNKTTEPKEITTRIANLLTCTSCKVPFWDVLSIHCDLCDTVACEKCMRQYKFDTIQLEQPISNVCASCVVRAVEDSICFKIAMKIRQEFYSGLLSKPTDFNCDILPADEEWNSDNENNSLYVGDE